MCDLSIVVCISHLGGTRSIVYLKSTISFTTNSESGSRDRSLPSQSAKSSIRLVFLLRDSFFFTMCHHIEHRNINE